MERNESDKFLAKRISLFKPSQEYAQAPPRLKMPRFEEEGNMIRPIPVFEPPQT